jgi:hypothetical protein
MVIDFSAILAVSKSMKIRAALILRVSDEVSSRPVVSILSAQYRPQVTA